MAHAQQLKFVSLVSEYYFKDKQNKKVLEIGSHDVNGSVRSFFSGTSYTGVDLSPGIGVDVVASGHEVDFADGYFDLTISCECFEHNPYWVETFQNMHRMTAHSGCVVVSCASRGRLEHGTTRTLPDSSPGTQEIGWDYYKNLTKADFKDAFDLENMFTHHLFFYIPVSQDLYFIGWKNDTSPHNLNAFIRDVNHIKNMSNSGGLVRYYLSIIERLLLYPLTMLDDHAYQNIMIDYTKRRNKIASTLKNAFRIK
jgi:SAM-dependent methyltransferase